VTIRCLLVDDEPLVRRGIRAFLAEVDDVEVIGEARNGVEALAAIRSGAPDLVFLDVQMPELDGLGVVAALAPGPMPAVVFVTAFDAYALKAFDVHAVDYLLKPFDEARFRTALDRARERLAGGREGLERRLGALLADLRPRAWLERIAIRRHEGTLFVDVASIDWLEAADNYVKVHALGARHLIRETLKTLESQLDPRRFARIHRSAIVNLDRVREVRALPRGDHAVRLANGSEITLGRGYRDAFEARMLGRR
jgi:two-component system LytT family response regulator